MPTGQALAKKAAEPLDEGREPLQENRTQHDGPEDAQYRRSWCAGGLELRLGVPFVALGHGFAFVSVTEQLAPSVQP